MSEAGVAYLFESVIRGREVGTRQFDPRNVRDALPNRTFTIPGKATFCYSEMAVIGQVTAAVKGPAFAHAGEDVVVPVDFDDPSAAERVVSVHVAVEECFGVLPDTSSLVFQMGLMGAEDPALFIDGLNSLGRIAMALTVRPRNGVLIPALQGALIARIDDEGLLTFPALAHEDEAFFSGVRSEEEFRAAAAEPPETVVLGYPSALD